jgi:hypothetical protein
MMLYHDLLFIFTYIIILYIPGEFIGLIFLLIKSLFNFGV